MFSIKILLFKYLLITYLLLLLLYNISNYIYDFRYFINFNTNPSPILLNHNNFTFFLYDTCKIKHIFNTKKSYSFINNSHRIYDPYLADIIIGDRLCVYELSLKDKLVKKLFSKSNSFLIDNTDSQNWEYNNVPSFNTHIMATNCRKPLFRDNYDICLPLHAEAKCNLIETNVINKKYLTTVMANEYIEGDGMFRSKLLPLHNPNNKVYIGLHCNGSTNHYLLKHSANKENYIEYCKTLTYIIPMTSYCDSLNSSYVITPGGRQPASYRFMEVLLAVINNYYIYYIILLYYYIIFINMLYFILFKNIGFNSFTFL
jgi:hypothetical protein